MEIKHINKIKETFTSLESDFNNQLPEIHKQKIKEALALLDTLEQQAQQQGMDRISLLSLSLQAASLLIELMKSP